MLFAQFKGRPHLLMAPADDDGSGGGAGALNISDDDGHNDQAVLEDVDPNAVVDRGDDLGDKIDPKALAKVAGQDTVAGGEDTVAGGEVDTGGKKGSAHVPIGRFNEVNEAKKALERENAELKAKVGAAPAATPAPPPPPAPKFDEDKAEREYMTFLADGDFDKAAAIRKEINAHLRSEARAEAVAESDQRQNMRETVQTLTQVATQAVKDWPYLDTEEGAETMELIIAARDRIATTKGIPLAEALQRAVAQIAPKFAPEGQAAPGKDSTGAQPGADTRSQQANARGAEASGRQPPRVDGGAGNRATAGKVNVEELTEAQFDALSAQEKSRLRGDA